MFNVGGPEILVILLLALVVLGPEQLPKAMRTFGNVMGEIRKVSGGFQAEMRKAIESIDDTASSDRATTTPTPPRPLATTPEEADVTEVVARNPLAPEADPSATPHGVGADDIEAAADDAAAIDPADRASG